MKKFSGLELAMYIVAAVFGVVFVWMFISSITYLNDYASQYGVTIGSMLGEALKYIVGQSLSYLAFALLFLVAGRIIKKVDITNDILVEAMFGEVDFPEECFGCEAETCEGCEVVNADSVCEEAPLDVEAETVASAAQAEEPEECKECKEETCDGCEVAAEPQAEEK